MPDLTPDLCDEGARAREVFGSVDYVRAFTEHRDLPVGLIDWFAWDLLRRRDPSQPARILDVGAGDGQFARSLVRVADSMSMAIHLTLLEPSSAFARIAGPVAGSGTSVDRVAATLDEYVSSGPKHDVVLLSEVVHSLGGPQVALSAAGEVCAPGGIVAVRAGTREQVAVRDWYRYFPAALEIDLARHATLREFGQAFGRLGFRSTFVDVDESRWLQAKEYIDTFVKRSYSALHLINEESHAAGVAALVGDVGKRRSVWLDAKMTWMVGVNQ